MNDLRKSSGRFERVFNHFRKGTLCERLRDEWRQYVRRRRSRWWASQSRKRKCIETRIQLGLTMRLYFDSILSYLIYYEDFEWAELTFLRSFLKPGDIFIDVGANIGLFTLIAARQVGNAGHVYAFEPSSKAYRRLLDNVQLNHLTNITCHQVALSDCSGQGDMTVSLDGFDAWNSLAQPIKGKVFEGETVNCIRWSDFAEQNDLVGRATMIKIDVEGWEARVLTGGEKILSREDSPILQVEFTEKASQAAGSSCREVYHCLEKLGYKMFIYEPTSNKLIPDPPRKAYPYMNLIASKRPDQISARLEESLSTVGCKR